MHHMLHAKHAECLSGINAPRSRRHIGAQDTPGLDTGRHYKTRSGTLAALPCMYIQMIGSDMGSCMSSCVPNPTCHRTCLVDIPGFACRDEVAQRRRRSTPMVNRGNLGAP
eukprot:364282-Chlamydomonas_euryale.AAC.39